MHYTFFVSEKIQYRNFITIGFSNHQLKYNIRNQRVAGVEDPVQLFQARKSGSHNSGI